MPFRKKTNPVDAEKVKLDAELALDKASRALAESENVAVLKRRLDLLERENTRALLRIEALELRAKYQGSYASKT